MTPHVWRKTYAMCGPYDLVHNGWQCRRCKWSIGMLSDEAGMDSPTPETLARFGTDDCDLQVVANVLKE